MPEHNPYIADYGRFWGACSTRLVIPSSSYEGRTTADDAGGRDGLRLRSGGCAGWRPAQRSVSHLSGIPAAWACELTSAPAWGGRR
jgi:hypothetical protein